MLSSLVALLVAAPAAATPDCVPISVFQTNGSSAFTGVDISGGSASTAVFGVKPFTQVLFRFTITDADNGITLADLLITESKEATTTAGPYLEFVPANGIYTGKKRRVQWNPQNAAEGKEPRIEWPVTGNFWTLALTFTGAGAGDLVGATIEGCN